MKIYVVLKHNKPIRIFEEEWAAHNWVKSQYYKPGDVEVRSFTDDHNYDASHGHTEAH